MGSSHSRPNKKPRRAGKARAQHPVQHQQQGAQISGPVGGPIMVPPVYRDAGGRPIQHASFTLTREILSRALDDMAAWLAQNGVTANIVTVGGAVNTLYLRSRDNTHDVDFFLANPTAPEHTAIHQAARHANRQVNGALGADWFNNATQVMMGRQVQQSLAAGAFQQNTIVYQRMGNGGGLRIYAAPWSYAFCGKLNRLCEVSHRSYDLADAISYLHEYLRTSGQQTVSARKIFGWCQQYRKNVTEAVLQRVDEAYRQAYGYRPIDWQSQS